jgi:hypothetical protein
MWYVYKGVVLTKDNLAERNWNGSKQYSFSCKGESIQHLIFYCSYVIFVWGLVHITFGIHPPLNTNDLFNTWSNILGGGGVKRQLLAAALAFCWAIWLSRNDIVFDNYCFGVLLGNMV